ncbi:putative UPF0658 Golgi apparatus membrane protein [Glarea lozoyensis 74030]|uniref:Putative UPF0658 Golgi apparatus membrane protein n=1 Tax=Glarea lozoyensis (strain ATCC 74030 / MF5533) TaxID=1104152 RepID=H0ER01_GLAL7|nr:putative UPF0658 Golgi apparatus membrane protein [Glarea lozoyensis 74030]
MLYVAQSRLQLCKYRGTELRSPPHLSYFTLSRLQLKNAIYSMADARDANGQPLVHLDQDIWGNVRGIMIASPIILGIGTALLFAILFKLLKHFSWIKYQHLNGDLIMRRRYLVYQGFLALLKIDFFMVIAFLTIYAVNVLSWRGWEFYATIAFAIGMILIPLLAAYLVRRESVPGMLVILTLFSAAIAYFVFKLHLMYAPSKTHYLYEATLTISTSYACLSIFFLSLTVACGVVCMLNFGHGLRGYLVNEHQEVGEEVADISVPRIVMENILEDSS